MGGGRAWAGGGFYWPSRDGRGQAASRRLSSWLMAVGACAARDGNVMLEAQPAGSRSEFALTRVACVRTNQRGRALKPQSTVLYLVVFRKKATWPWRARATPRPRPRESTRRPSATPRRPPARAARAPRQVNLAGSGSGPDPPGPAYCALRAFWFILSRYMTSVITLQSLLSYLRARHRERPVTLSLREQTTN